jgi:ATP-binding cassette, subfamily B, bacterial
VASWLRERQEWKFFAVLPKAHRGLAFTWWLLLLLAGTLPAVFAIAMGWTVAAVQSGAPLGSPLLLVGTLFVVRQVVGPIRIAISQNLGDLVSAWDQRVPLPARRPWPSCCAACTTRPPAPSR